MTALKKKIQSTCLGGGAVSQVTWNLNPVSGSDPNPNPIREPAVRGAVGAGVAVGTGVGTVRGAVGTVRDAVGTGVGTVREEVGAGVGTDREEKVGAGVAGGLGVCNGRPRTSGASIYLSRCVYLFIQVRLLLAASVHADGQNEIKSSAHADGQDEQHALELAFALD
ncbi:hypothetical protein T492DRAFT_851101, partial [Pavlovales sp. CCMP2436]